VEHPKDVGDRSTLAIILALHARGFTVLLPFGENTRYDLVIDDSKKMARVQCKTGRLVDGSVIFRTSSSYVHHAKPKVPTRTYLGEIDQFAVYCPKLGRVYLIPIEDVATKQYASLRVEQPRNGQLKRIRLASAYEIGRVAVS